MSLQARPVHVPAGSGIEEATRPELLEPGATSLVQENVRQDRRGGLSKRLGFSSITATRLDGGSRSAGYKLLPLGNQMCVADGTHLDVYSESAARWVQAGRIPEATAKLLPAPTGSQLIAWLYEDIAYCNGYFVFCADRFASVIDKDGALVRNVETVHGASGSSRVGVYGTTVVLLLAESGSSKNIAAYTLDCSSASGLSAGWVSRGNIATDKLAGSLAISVAQGASDRIGVAYISDGSGFATSRVRVRTVNTAAVNNLYVSTSSVVPDSVSLAYHATDATYWVAWNETTSVKAAAYSSDLSTTSASAATLITLNTAPNLATDLVIASSSSTGRGRIAANDGAQDRAQFANFQTSGGATALDGVAQTIYNVRVCSRMYRRGSRYYALCTPGSNLTNGSDTVLFCDVTDNDTKVRPVALVEPGLASSLLGFVLPNIVVGASSSKVYVPFSLRRAGTTWASAQLLEVDFAATTRFQAVQHAGATYLASGVLTKFDGSKLREANFLVSPTKPTVTPAAGSLSPTIGYRWVAVYETNDGDGNWTPGGVSTPSDLSGTTASRQYTIATRPYTMGNTDCRVSFYRTTDGGTVYYFTGDTTNAPGSATVTFLDTNSDATITSNARLYGTGVLPGTNGAAQDRRASPGFSCLVSYNDMLVGASGSTLWHSSQTVLGEGLWFSPVFRLDMTDGEDITGLAAQDGTLYVFKRRGVFAVAGEPPSDNGAAGGFGTPRRLAADVGCIDPRSLVVTSLGIFFQSERGLEILTRAQSVEWIGEPVQATLASYPVVVAATLDTQHALVRFECAASETDNVVASTGVTLVYDLTQKLWVSVDKLRATLNADRSAQSAAVVKYAGVWRYARLDKNGLVYVEQLTTDSAPYLDVTSGVSWWVTMKWETPSFKLGLQQEQRLWSAMLLYERHSAIGLQVEVAHDFAGYTETKTWSEAEVLSGARRLEWRPKPRGQSQRYRFTDQQPVTLGTGRGLTFIGLTVNVAPKQGSTTGTPRLDPSLRK